MIEKLDDKVFEHREGEGTSSLQARWFAEIIKKVGEIAAAHNVIEARYNEHTHLYDQPNIFGGIDGNGSTSKPLPPQSNKQDLSK